MKKTFFLREYRTSLTDNIITRLIFNFLKSNNKSNLKVVFTNDLIGKKILIDGIYEGGVLEDLMILLKKLEFNSSNKIALDIGANIGNHSVFFSRLFKEVHSFEPHPETFELLQINTRNKNITVHNIGVGSKTEELHLNDCILNKGASSIVNKGDVQKQFRIPVKPLDSYLKLISGKIGLIKIDVEGYEYEVLKGSQEIITRNRPIIMIEQLKNEFSNGTTNSIEFLRKNNYNIIFPEIADNKSQSFIAKIIRLFKTTHVQKYVLDEVIPVNDYSTLFCLPNEIINFKH